MSVLTYEGIVEDGCIRLAEHVSLPENTKVFVVVPGQSVAQTVRVRTPRLVDPRQAGDFVKHVIEDCDAGV